MNRSNTLNIEGVQIPRQLTTYDRGLDLCKNHRPSSPRCFGSLTSKVSHTPQESGSKVQTIFCRATAANHESTCPCICSAEDFHGEPANGT